MLGASVVTFLVLGACDEPKTRMQHLTRHSSASCAVAGPHVRLLPSMLGARPSPSLARGSLARRRCGIIGIHQSAGDVSPLLYEGLLMLQHRGQDSAGMVTTDGSRYCERKANGFVSAVFDSAQSLQALPGRTGLGHVRYPTAGTLSAQEAQPFFVNSPLGMYLVHNGNLTNAEELRAGLNSSTSFFRRLLRTGSDSEVLLNVLADELHRAHARCQARGARNPSECVAELLVEAVASTMSLARGAYSCICLVRGAGLLAFRDPHGIRPLVLGRRVAEGCEHLPQEQQTYDYAVASEDCSFGPIGFERVRDVAPGELVLVREDGQLLSAQCAERSSSGAARSSPASSDEEGSPAAVSSTPSSLAAPPAAEPSDWATRALRSVRRGEAALPPPPGAPRPTPCIFEYIYLARPDSVLNDISVYDFQLSLGERLASRVRDRGWPIDVVCPVPDGSRPAAIAIGSALDLPYREGLVKNRYVGRTFIMPDQRQRETSVRRKLNAMSAAFRGKNVLLVDDSIVRGTTMRQIVDMVRRAGAARVYLASASPAVRFPNVYGVDMPSRREFVAHEKTEEEVALLLGADGLVYQQVEDLVAAGRAINPKLRAFDASCFTGRYVTGDIDEPYLEALERNGRGSRKFELDAEAQGTSGGAVPAPQAHQDAARRRQGVPAHA